MSPLILRTPPVNWTPPVGERTRCGALPLCVAWPHLLPPGACRPTLSCPRVPHTLRDAFVAHQVSEQDSVFHMATQTDGIFPIFFLFDGAGGKGTPASSTPATSSPPLTLTDDFPIISLPANTIQSSPSRKVWYCLWKKNEINHDVVFSSYVGFSVANVD